MPVPQDAIDERSTRFRIILMVMQAGASSIREAASRMAKIPEGAGANGYCPGGITVNCSLGKDICPQ